MAIKVLVSDQLSEKGLDILQKQKDFEVDVKTKLTPDELCAVIGEYDALLIRSATKVTKEVIVAAKKLKLIGRAGVGVDNVDIPAATKKGIIVMNTPGGNTISTAEHTVSMILALSRNIPQASSSVKQGQWLRKKFTGVEVLGKTLGIIGLGRIGLEVAKRVLSFKMKVLVYDPFVNLEMLQNLDIETVELEDLFKRADYITVHTPLNDDTRGLIGEKTFPLMKDGVRIINCARGGIVNENDLYNAIISGKVAGAALDVFEKEPPENKKLLELEQVITTCHLGASTEEAQVNVAVDVVEQAMSALQGGPVLNAVNMPSVDAELIKQLKPYSILGEKLGLFLAQLMNGNLKEIRIEYKGTVASFEIGPITLSVIKGVLENVLAESVNFVNAPIFARERGIKITESKQGSVTDFADSIVITTITDKETASVEGTLFGLKNDPRIVRINDYLVDATPEGFLLVLTNEDKPGVIGNVSTQLGEARINIANMSVGRNVQGGKAITLINIDTPIDDVLLSKIANVAHIVRVKRVCL
ncbi:phosphoglycerate dehydrogenase [Chlamydiota bacterium]